VDPRPRRLRLDLAGLLSALADEVGQGLGAVVAEVEAAAAGRPTVQVTHIEIVLPSRVEPPPFVEAGGPRALGPVLATLPSAYPAASARPMGNFRLRLQPVEAAATAAAPPAEPTR